MDWYQWKLFFQHSTGFSMDALHMIVGVLAQFIIAAIFRTSLSRLLPWLVVLCVELANEANDFRIEIWPDPGMQFGEAIKDVVLTMFLPTLLMIVARYWPHLLVRGGASKEERSTVG